VAIQKPEWFKIDAAKFLSDTLVDAMSPQELGACIRLLCRQWIDGFVPDDMQLLARLCRLDGEAMAEAWVILSNFFPAMEPGKRANRFMWIERERVIADLERKSSEGTRAARKRWDNVREHRDSEPSGLPNAEHNGLGIAAGNGPSIPAAVQDQTREDQSREGAYAPPPSDPPASATKRRRSVEMPEWFKPNNQHRVLAAELGVDLEAAFSKFADHHASRGKKFVDWNRALNNWLRNEREFTRGPKADKADASPITGSAVKNTLALLKDGTT
jgi:uncharacterized protein YdaU (DUF1376 family)